MKNTVTQERIIEAKKSEPLRQQTEKELNDLVNHLAIVVGVSETTQAERVVTGKFLQDNYATLGTMEVFLAFDFAFAGKFNIPDVRVKSISPRFVGMIITAYENFKRVEMKGVIEFLQIPAMSESEIQKQNREAIKFFYERHKENRKQKLNPAYKQKYYPGSVCFDWLRKSGIELPEPKEIKPHDIKDRRMAMEIAADAAAIGKTEVVHEYFDSLIKQGK